MKKIFILQLRGFILGNSEAIIVQPAVSIHQQDAIGNCRENKGKKRKKGQKRKIKKKKISTDK